MTNFTRLYKSIGKILWGYVFILFSINIGTVDILPDFAGYILLMIGIISAADELEHLSLLKALSIVMAVWSAFVWVCDIFAISSEVFTYISASVGAVNIILNFTLLSELAAICGNYQTTEQKLDKKLLTARNIYVVCIGASVLSSLLLLIFSKTEEVLIAITVAVSLICIVMFIVVMVLLLQGLSGLKKRLMTLSQSCCVPFSSDEPDLQKEFLTGYNDTDITE